MTAAAGGGRRGKKARRDAAGALGAPAPWALVRWLVSVLLMPLPRRFRVVAGSGSAGHWDVSLRAVVREGHDDINWAMPALRRAGPDSLLYNRHGVVVAMQPTASGSVPSAAGRQRGGFQFRRGSPR